MPRKSSFESHLKALESAVERLERGDLPLADALTLFEEGIGHVRECQSALQTVAQKVERLVREAEGTLATVPDPLGEEE